MSKSKLYCVSNNRRVEIFEPVLTRLPLNNSLKEVVVATTDSKLFNHLLPRNCPAISFGPIESTTEEDKKRYFELSECRTVLCIESKWLSHIQRSILYTYEVPSRKFVLLDETTGYYVSTVPVVPISAKPVYNIIEELIRRNIELRFVSNLDKIVCILKKSSLHYSIFGLGTAQQVIQQIK